MRVARWLHGGRKGGGGSSQRDTRTRPEQFSAAPLLGHFLLRLSVMRGVRATLLEVRGQPLAIVPSPGLLVRGDPAPSFEACGY